MKKRLRSLFLFAQRSWQTRQAERSHRKLEVHNVSKPASAVLVSKRIADGSILNLIEMLLKSDVMVGSNWRVSWVARKAG